MSKLRFPFGTWRVQSNKVFDNMFAQFQYHGTSKSYVWGVAKQSGFVTGGGAYGRRTQLTGVSVNGYTLKAKYSVLDSDKEKQSGSFRAKLKKDGSLDIDYTRDSDYISRWHSESAEPSSKDPMKPDPANAGLRHEVRLNTVGLPIKAGAAATLGNLEVRDLGAGWEKHYALTAGAIGVTAGVSIPIPSTTTWKRIDLQPRVRDWSGTEVRMYTEGGTCVVVSEGKIFLNLMFKGQKGTKGATWISKLGFTFSPKVEIDMGTFAVGKLGPVVSSKPYFAGAG